MHCSSPFLHHVQFGGIGKGYRCQGSKLRCVLVPVKQLQVRVQEPHLSPTVTCHDKAGVQRERGGKMSVHMLENVLAIIHCLLY